MRFLKEHFQSLENVDPPSWQFSFCVEGAEEGRMFTSGPTVVPQPERTGQKVNTVFLPSH